MDNTEKHPEESADTECDGAAKRRQSTHKKGKRAISFSAAQKVREDMDRHKIKPPELARYAGVSDNTMRTWLRDLGDLDEERTRKLADAMRSAMRARGFDGSGYDLVSMTKDDGDEFVRPRGPLVAQFVERAFAQLGPDLERDALRWIWAALLAKWDGEGMKKDMLTQAMYKRAVHGRLASLTDEEEEALQRYIYEEEMGAGIEAAMWGDIPF